MIRLSEEAQQKTNFEAWLRRETIIEDSECKKLSKTYSDLKRTSSRRSKSYMGICS